MALRLIERRQNRGFRTLGTEGDLRDHFAITDDGRRHLSLLEELGGPTDPPPP